MKHLTSIISGRAAWLFAFTALVGLAATASAQSSVPRSDLWVTNGTVNA